MNKKERIQELINQIRLADKAYYEDNNPILLDYEYDALLDELIKLEKETGIILKDSPSQKVSGAPSGDFVKYKHKYPMLSLSKTKLISDIADFINNTSSILSYKLDGLTLVAYYKNKKLDKLVTRGDGKIGEDVTSNIKLFTDIPLTINIPGDSVIRGEAVISYEKFENINKQAGNIYKNPRNLASGLVRSKYSNYNKVIDFITYEICGSNLDFNKQLEILKNNNFDVVQNKIINQDNLNQSFNDFKAENSIYPVDGLVIRLNSNEYVNKLGTNNKTPNYAMAFKWQDETAITKVKDVFWSTSRTGVLTPVVIFEPVEIEGTTIEKASAHNLSIFNRLELGIGDEIEVYKANMIIPQILINHTKSNNLKAPDKCPSCDSILIVEQGASENVENLICPNYECPDRLVYNMTLFTSKEGFDIIGLSEKTIELLINKKIIKTEKDIFSLKDKKEEILKLPLFGEKSYNNLIDSIEKARTIKADKFIRAFGIDMVGNSATEKIFNKESSKEAILKLLEMDAQEIKSNFGLGEVVSDKLANYQYKNKIIELLDIVIIDPIDQSTSTRNSLQGLNFVITGRLSTINRNDLINEIEALGGKVQSGVNNKTNFLINNNINSNSSKNKKAKELNIPIITENQALELLKN